jgi:hypothetical protein
VNITIHRDGQNYGPYTLDQAKEHVTAGSLSQADLAWYEGCTSWIPLGEAISNLGAPLPVVPPPPPSFSPSPSTPIASEPKPPCFSVSLLKLGVLSVTTFGLYDLYWMYQNWKLVKEREGQNLMPFWRAFFAVIWIYPLLKRIRETLVAHKTIAHEDDLAAGMFAIAWILIYFLYKLPDPFWCLSSLSFIALIPVQSKVNEMNSVAAPNHPLNSRFTWANWLWIILGGFLTILAVIGSFQPDN